MLETIECSTILPASQAQLFQDWLSSPAHSAFTGSAAQIDPTSSGRFSAWEGYIEGITLEIEPYQRIVQAWRTSEFPPKSPDSRLEITFEVVENGVCLRLLHTDIPEGQGAEYLQGWEDYYFKPMQAYYSNKSIE